MPYDQKKIVEAIRAFERGEIVVVGDDDHLALLEGANGVNHPLHVRGHGNVHFLDAALMVSRR